MIANPNKLWQPGILAVSILTLVSGCKTVEQEPPTFVRAVPQEPPKIIASIETSALPAVQQTYKPIDDDSRVDQDVEAGLPAIEAARKEALTASAPEGFVNAIQYFNYVEGALYELHAGVGFVSTIQLQPGEQLVNYAAGDTSRWIIGDVARGDQTLLLVKPTRADLKTNLVISTDKRIYLIEAESHKGNAYNATIAWTYPFEEVSQQVAIVEAENKRRDETVIAGVPLDQLDFNYEIEGDNPSWRPIRAFSDGSKTYIEFPESLGTAEAPPLFLSDGGDGGQLVNYRVKQNYYIVDRLFDQAELRLDGTVVSISKDGSSGWGRWFAGSSKNTKVAEWDPKGKCKLCRDPDDNGRDGQDYGGDDKGEKW